MGINQHIVKYTKSASFTTSGIDGVYGGIAPSGKINVNFFVEAAYSPDQITLNVDAITGRVLSEDPLDLKDTISVRELFTAINIDLDTAKSIYTWLGSKIKELESLTNQNTEITK